MQTKHLNIPTELAAAVVVLFMTIGVGLHFVEAWATAVPVHCAEVEPVAQITYAALEVPEPPASLMTSGKFSVEYPRPAAIDFQPRPAKPVKIATATKKKKRYW
jgi:hypothetical protein